MAERDRTTVHVHALRVEPELTNHDQALRREGFVELDQIDVRGTDPRTLEQLPDRWHGPDPHHARVDSCDGAGNERAERLSAELTSPLLARDQERGGAVVDPARIARGHGPVAAEGRLQRGQLFGARVRPRMLVSSTSPTAI